MSKLPQGKHPNSHRNLRPWKPGQSGNPAGRPRQPWKQRLESLNPEMLEVLVGIMRGHWPESGGVAAIKRVPIGERRRATEFIATLLHGRPKQPIESDLPTNFTIRVTHADVVQRRKE